MEITLARIAPIFASKTRIKSGEALLANVRFVWFVAVLLAILHAVMAVTASMEKSPTFDEPTHLTAGYSYWLMNDYRLDSENGNLIARWEALPLLLNRPNFPSLDAPAWRYGLVGDLSRQFFYRSGNNSDRFLLPARAMTAVLSALLCLTIFFVSKKLFGPIGGLISESVAVFDPNLLAHGALVTSDTAAALFFLLATWNYWRMLHRLNWFRFAVGVLSVAVLFLTKMSAPLFLLSAAILGAIRVFSEEPITVKFGGFKKIVTSRWQKAMTVFGSTAAIGVFVVLSIWTCFAFRFSAVAESGQIRQTFSEHWDALLEEHGPAETAVAFARAHRLLPEGYLYGLAFVYKSAQQRPSFLDGEWSETGFSAFFPRAFFYKTPLPVFLVTLLAVIAAGLRWRLAMPRDRWKTITNHFRRISPIATLLLIYGAVALATKLNIGHRHLLPIYPAIFVTCGACFYFFQTRRHRALAFAVAITILWQAGEAFATHPDYLAYFNEIVGGSSNGYKHLVDSSLDWGQDLPALSGWLHAHEPGREREPVYLSYFGAADPQWYGIVANSLPADSIERAMIRLQPGIYCISATILQQVYSDAPGRWADRYETVYRADVNQMRRHENLDPDRQNKLRWGLEHLRFARLCAYLRHRQPIAEAGHSILIFQVSDNDLRTALDGPSPE